LYGQFQNKTTDMLTAAEYYAYATQVLYCIMHFSRSIMLASFILQ